MHATPRPADDSASVRSGADVDEVSISNPADIKGDQETGEPFDQNDAQFLRSYNHFRSAVLGLVGKTPEAELAKTRAIEEKHHKRCESWKWNFMRRDPAVIFMIEKIKEAGCEVDPVRHISCAPCSYPAGASFCRQEGVKLCQNHLRDKTMAEEALVHELIHAYDHCRYKVDWDNLYHHACSEVRAANLSGDCRLLNEIKRGHVGFVGHHMECVRRRAMKAVIVNPNCPDQATAERVVNRVFTSCFNDTTPFEEGHYY